MHCMTLQQMNARCHVQSCSRAQKIALASSSTDFGQEVASLHHLARHRVCPRSPVSYYTPVSNVAAQARSLIEAQMRHAEQTEVQGTKEDRHDKNNEAGSIRTTGGYRRAAQGAAHNRTKKEHRKAEGIIEPQDVSFACCRCWYVDAVDMPGIPYETANNLTALSVASSKSLLAPSISRQATALSFSPLPPCKASHESTNALLRSSESASCFMLLKVDLMDLTFRDASL